MIRFYISTDGKFREFATDGKNWVTPFQVMYTSSGRKLCPTQLIDQEVEMMTKNIKEIPMSSLDIETVDSFVDLLEKIALEEAKEAEKWAGTGI